MIVHVALPDGMVVTLTSCPKCNAVVMGRLGREGEELLLHVALAHPEE